MYYHDVIQGVRKSYFGQFERIAVLIVGSDAVHNNFKSNRSRNVVDNR